MFLRPTKDIIGQGPWHSWQASLRSAYAALGHETDDPILFHGTNAVSAGWILRDGFTPQHLFSMPCDRAPCMEGVYWGHPSVAAAFAVTHIRADSMPVLLAARASDVAASTPDGILRPDWFACMDAGCPRVWPDGMDWDSEGTHPYFPMLSDRPYDDVEPTGWQQSLAWSGCVTAPDGRHVPNLVLLLPECEWTADARLSRALVSSDAPIPWGRRFGQELPPGMESSMNPRATCGARTVPGDLDSLMQLRQGCIP